MAINLTFDTPADLVGFIESLSNVLAAKHATLDQIYKALGGIMATEQQVVDALMKIDAATTTIAGNVSNVAGGLATVSDEIDALQSALKNAGVSDALVLQAGQLSDRVQAASDALGAQVPVLQQIAAKGVSNPVPVPPPAPGA